MNNKNLNEEIINNSIKEELNEFNKQMHRSVCIDIFLPYNLENVVVINIHSALISANFERFIYKETR